MANTLWIWIAFFALVVALTRVRPRYFKHRIFSLLRIFVPSWRFFDEVGPSPLLYYRCGADRESLGAWASAGSSRPRGIGALFLNPEGNLNLAANSLAEQLMHDIGEQAQVQVQVQVQVNEVRLVGIEASVSYRLLDRWAAWQLREHPQSFYQFKVSWVSPGSLSEDLLISPVLELR